MNRRSFVALSAAALLGPLSLSKAFAKEFAAYQPSNFVKLLGSGGPLVVHVHADWCAVCKAQLPVMTSVLSGSKYRNVRAIRVNFDRDKQFLADYKVIRQSTILVFRGGKEISRLSYETDPARIEQTLEQAIS